MNEKEKREDPTAIIVDAWKSLLSDAFAKGVDIGRRLERLGATGGGKPKPKKRLGADLRDGRGLRPVEKVLRVLDNNNTVLTVAGSDDEYCVEPGQLQLMDEDWEAKQ